VFFSGCFAFFVFAHGLNRVGRDFSCRAPACAKIRRVIEVFLSAAGYHLTAVADAYFCHRSSQNNYDKIKLMALDANQPAVFSTANMGCLSHPQVGSVLPVWYWIALIDEVLG
jgi:hypothetical protein